MWDARVGVLACRGGGGTLLHSSDMGQSWTPIVLDETEGFYALDFTEDGQTGLVVGSFGTAWHTSDAGESWRELVMPTDEYLRDVVLISSGLAAVVSDQGSLLMTTEPDFTNWE